jgi:PAS domain S-box-containing protein
MQDRDNKLYALLFETANEGLLVASANGSIKLVNPRVSEIFGYDHEELKSLNVDDLLPKHLRAKHVTHRENYTETPHKRPMGKGYDLIGVRKDGTSVPIEISLNYYRDGEDLMVMALIMDVTERKQQEAEISMMNKNLEKRVKKRTKELRDSQQLYRSIAKNFPNGTINVLNAKFEYVFVEGEVFDRLNMNSDRLVGKSYLQYVPESKRDELMVCFNQVLDRKNQSFELKNLNQYYLINTVGLENEHGEIDRILLVEQNITPQKLAEEKTLASLEKEKQLNELKSRFVSMASHEFRTPLSTVLSSLSLIEKYDIAGVQDKKDKHYQRIRGSVRHLTSILNDFLSLEKVEAGKVSVNLNKLNIKELVDEIVEQHQEVAKPGQRIELNYSGLEMAQTDQNMFRIILSNLMSNASKYSPSDAQINVIIKVETHRMELVVKDHGIGIPLEDQANLFSRFFRAKNAVNLEGTGLGLSIVKRYIEMLSGEISFHSAADEGTTFTVILPS